MGFYSRRSGGGLLFHSRGILTAFVQSSAEAKERKIDVTGTVVRLKVPKA